MMPDSYAQRVSYVKTTQKDIKYTNPILVFSKGADTFVKINTFSVEDKKQMQSVTEQLDEVARTSSEGSRTFFDLRYADDGDDTVVTTILSYLIDEPKNLYPSMYRRYKDSIVLAEQIPISPSENRLKGDVCFLVDQSCFYTPQRTILFFIAENQIGRCIGNIDATSPTLYIDEFWRILPNTRVYVVMPTEKAEIDAQKWDDFLVSIEGNNSVDVEAFKLTKEMLYSHEAYEKYVGQIPQLFNTEVSTNSQ